MPCLDDTSIFPALRLPGQGRRVIHEYITEEPRICFVITVDVSANKIPGIVPILQLWVAVVNSSQLAVYNNNTTVPPVPAQGTIATTTGSTRHKVPVYEYEYEYDRYTSTNTYHRYKYKVLQQGYCCILLPYTSKLPACARTVGVVPVPACTHTTT